MAAAPLLVYISVQQQVLGSKAGFLDFRKVMQVSGSTPVLHLKRWGHDLA